MIRSLTGVCSTNVTMIGQYSTYHVNVTEVDSHDIVATIASCVNSLMWPFVAVLPSIPIPLERDRRTDRRGRTRELRTERREHKKTEGTRELRGQENREKREDKRFDDMKRGGPYSQEFDYLWKSLTFWPIHTRPHQLHWGQWLGFGGVYILVYLIQKMLSVGCPYLCMRMRWACVNQATHN